MDSLSARKSHRNSRQWDNWAAPAHCQGQNCCLQNRGGSGVDFRIRLFFLLGKKVWIFFYPSNIKELLSLFNVNIRWFMNNILWLIRDTFCLHFSQQVNFSGIWMKSNLRVPSNLVAIVSKNVFWGAKSPFRPGMMYLKKCIVKYFHFSPFEPRWFILLWIMHQSNLLLCMHYIIKRIFLKMYLGLYFKCIH